MNWAAMSARDSALRQSIKSQMSTGVCVTATVIVIVDVTLCVPVSLCPSSVPVPVSLSVSACVYVPAATAENSFADVPR